MIVKFLFESMVFALIVGIVLIRNERSKTILQKWADANQFEIFDNKSRLLYSGPFKWWTTRRYQTVYSFNVRDRQGNERSGWARCGTQWGGIFFSDRIEIKWD